MKPRFFRTAASFRAWLVKNHASKTELLVGFYTKGSGRPSITYPEALDEALAVGWIDGIRRNLDQESYSIRFTPRKATSIWSGVNIRRVTELIELGRMQPAGLAAFARRDEKRSRIYSYEKAPVALDGEALSVFKADRKAWTFYDGMATYYKRVTASWVVSAKKPETRARRLSILIECSRKGERIPAMRYTKDRKDRTR